MKINVYGTDRCPKCDTLKGFLKSIGCVFNMCDMSDPSNIAYLMAYGGWARDAAAPTLELVDDENIPTFLTHDKMFEHGRLNEAKISGFLGVGNRCR